MYHDEEAMSDDRVVEDGLTGVAELMVNDFTSKAIGEFAKATLKITNATWKFDDVVDPLGICTDISNKGSWGNGDVVDALALMNVEAEEGLFLLISPANLAAFRKNLKDSLQFAEAFARSGYIGSVCGVPVYVSKAIPANKAFLASKEAVTLFLKKDTEREVDRDPNNRTTTEYIRKVALVALTDARKVVMITSEAE